MAYNATAVADWDKTKPVGSSEVPSVLDDAIREIKTCVENDLNEALFPATTNMLFGQSAAPTGWTKKTDWQDQSMIVYTTGSIAQGGSVDAKATHQHGAFTLAGNEIPAHTHGRSRSSSGGGDGGAYSVCSAAGIIADIATGSYGGGSSHQHTANTAPYFLSVISCTKD